MYPKIDLTKLNRRSSTEQPRFNEEQEAVLKAEVQNILVSAAAGSGKTTVLTDRIVQRVLRGDLDLRNVLVVTFTEKAAMEMQSRLRQKLQLAAQQVFDEAERLKAQEQLLWLSQSYISTFHAFCLQLIREHSFELKDAQGELILDPNMRLLDEDASRELFAETVGQCFEIWYERYAERQDDSERTDKIRAESQAFYDLLDAYGVNGSMTNIAAMITGIYEKLRSLPAYRRELQKQLTDSRRIAHCFISSETAHLHLLEFKKRLEPAWQRIYAGENPLIDALADEEISLKYGETTDEEAKSVLRQCFAVVDDLKRSLAGLDFLTDLVGEGRRSATETELAQLRTAWDYIVQSGKRVPPLTRLSKPSLKSVAKDDAKARTRDLIEGVKGPVLETLLFFVDHYWEKYVVQPATHEPFLYPTELNIMQTVADIEADLQKMQPLLAMFVQLLLEIDTAFAAKKQRLNSLDFADFEQFAHRLLQNESIASFYRTQFQEVYVDEYQDTNEIQSDILSRITDHNLFLVGDVKQSIYRFRHANPGLFNHKFKTYHAAALLPSLTENYPGMKYLMNKNYRSVPDILEMTNSLFGELFKGEKTEIDYEQGHAFVDARLGKLSPAVEFCAGSLLDEKSFKQVLCLPKWKSEDRVVDSENVPRPPYKRGDAQCLQAIAKLLQARKEGYDWTDMCILTFKNDSVERMGRWLNYFGIPVHSKAKSSWPQATEVQQILACLQLMDNRLQDEPLVTTLLSAFTPRRFLPEELAMIRLQKRQGYFYEALDSFLEEKWEEGSAEFILKVDLQKFRQAYWDLRERAKYLPIVSLIEEIEQNGIYADALLAEDAHTRLLNLQKFTQYAEMLSGQYAYQINQFCAKFQHFASENFEVNDPTATLLPGVQVMTYHASKGLEFPVVCMIDLARNLRNSRGGGFEYAAHQVELGKMDGLIYKFADPQGDVKSDTVLTNLYYWRENEAAKAEVLRLLYVGMTRARDKLYLLGSFASFASLREYLELDLDLTEQPIETIMQAKTYWDFLLLAWQHRLRKDPTVWKKWSTFWLENPLCQKMDCKKKAILQDDLNIAKSYSWTVNAQDEGNVRWNMSLQIWPSLNAMLEQLAAQLQLTLADESSAIDQVAAQNDVVLLNHITQNDVPDQDLGTQQVVPDRAFEKKEGEWNRVFCLPSQGLSWSYTKPQLKALKTTVSEMKRLSAHQEEEEDKLDGKSLLSIHEQANFLLQPWSWTEKLQKIDEERAAVLNFSTMSKEETASLKEEKIEATSQLTGAALGTLLHHFLRLLDFDRFFSLADVDEQESCLAAELERFTTYHFINEDQAKALRTYFPQFLGFFQGELFAIIAKACRKGGYYYREMPFTMRLEEETLIQGMIDLWIHTDDGVILVDYKSDYISGTAEERRKIFEERYQIQLDYYARALQKATGKAVLAKYIWSIRDSELICLP